MFVGRLSRVDQAAGVLNLAVGEILGIQRVPEFLPSALQDEVQFFLSERAVFMGDSDPAVELGVAAELFSMPGIPTSIRAMLLRPKLVGEPAVFLGGAETL